MNRHTHYHADSISVCEACNINRRLVETLNNNGLFKWWQVATARRGTDLIYMKGIGGRSIDRLNKMRILKP